MLEIVIGVICAVALTTFLLVIASNIMEARDLKIAYDRLTEENKND